ncbi:MAG TPA: EAL domain-containing protein [Acidimicrobiales bacterium]|nr:EAL domain-containing protein [Acidimicrobiales bacterium]
MSLPRPAGQGTKAGLSRAELERLAASQIDPIIVFWVEGPDRFRHCYVDPRAAEVTGRTPEECQGTLVEDLFPPDVVERFRVNAIEAIATRQTVRYEASTNVPGVPRTVETTIWPVLDDDDRCVQLVASLRDVTSRVANAAERDASERRLRKLMEHAPDVVWLIGADGTVLYATAAVERLLGYRVDEIIGQSSFVMVDEADIPAMTEFFGGVLALPPGSPLTMELKTVRRDRQYRWTECTVTNMLEDPDIGAIVVNAHDITARKEVEEQLAHQALHDALTGLPNRMLIPDQIALVLSRPMDEEHLAAVLFIDLDSFKLVNDTLGHDVGDRVIRETAQRLEQVLANTGWIARFGGDEFIVVPTKPAPIERHFALAQNLCKALEPPFQLGGSPVYITASIGIATTSRSEGIDPSTLLRNADMAMYEAKRRRSGNIQLFDSSLQHIAEQRLETMSSLRSAIEEDRLVIHYQPVFGTASQRPVGVEALLRWNHPTRGLVGPGEFIDVAEETGLIVPIGEWVINRACQQLADWSRRGFPRLQASVNVSPKQLLDPEFVNKLRTAVARAGIDPTSLVVEITENLIMEDPATARAVLEEVAELGIGCAIDDFGMGYSSLAYLTRFPATILKIDRTFVAPLGEESNNPLQYSDDTTLVAAIVGMAHALGLVVVAEGVENEAQLIELRRLGCEYAQGFHLARPGPVAQIEALLQRAMSSAI